VEELSDLLVFASDEFITTRLELPSSGVSLLVWRLEDLSS